MCICHRLSTRLMIAGLVTTAFISGGCGGQRVYDPYYNDYHRWNGTEDGFYRRWEGETHRPHIGFSHRPAAEQHEYFDWRHSHR